MKNQENVSKEYYLEGYIYLALSSQKSIALFFRQGGKFKKFTGEYRIR